ncbi:MAG: energy transducer TonB [Saprospiraceae bacterium]|nr:energy transducer TonB [Saprospiraceae bacterium]
MRDNTEQEMDANDELDYLHADWEDVVFRYRNKDYGAYLLRKRYPKRLILASTIAIGLFLIFLNFPSILNLFNPDEADDETLHFTEVTLNEPPPKKPATPPVIKEEPKKAKKKPKPKPTKKAPTDPLPIPSEPITVVTENEVEVDTTGAADTDGEGEAGDATKKQEETPIVYPMAEYNDKEDRPPVFPNGEAGMLRFIYENIRYPKPAIDKGIEGIVRVSFTVDKNGVVADVKPLNDIGGGCTEEAVRIIKKMPAWHPGQIKGRPIKVRQTLPIKFELKG